MFNKRFHFIDRPLSTNIQSWNNVLNKAIAKFDKGTLFIFGYTANPAKVTRGKKGLKAVQNFHEKLLLFVKN